MNKMLDDLDKMAAKRQDFWIKQQAEARKKQLNSIYEPLKKDKRTDEQSDNTWVKQTLQAWTQKLEDALGEQMNTQVKTKSISENFTTVEVDKISILKNYAKDYRGKCFGKIHGEHLVIAGGCFTSLLHQDRPNDIDCFIINDAQSRYGSWFNDLVDDKRLVRSPSAKYTPGTDALTKNIIGVFNDKANIYTSRGLDLQYIYTTYQTREHLLADFDFEHDKISYYKNVLYTSPLALECAENKLLYAKNPPKQNRIEKFLNRGFKWHPNSPFTKSL